MISFIKNLSTVASTPHTYFNARPNTTGFTPATGTNLSLFTTVLTNGANSGVTKINDTTVSLDPGFYMIAIDFDYSYSGTYVGMRPYIGGSLYWINDEHYITMTGGAVSGPNNGKYMSNLLFFIRITTTQNFFVRIETLLGTTGTLTFTDKARTSIKRLDV